VSANTDSPTKEVPSALNESLIDNVDEDVKLYLQESSRNSSASFHNKGTFYWFAQALHDSVMVRLAGVSKFYEEVFQGQFTKHFSKFVQEVVAQHIACLKAKLADTRPDMQSLTQGLAVVNAGMKSLVDSNAQAMLTELIEHCIRTAMDSCMEDLKAAAERFLSILQEEVPSEPTIEQIEAAAEHCSYNFVYAIVASLAEAEPLMRCYEHYLGSSHSFLVMIADQLIQYFWSMYSSVTRHSMIAYDPNPPAVEPKGCHFLAILKMAISFEQTGIFKILKTLVENYSQGSVSEAQVSSVLDRQAKSEVIEIVRQMQGALLNSYVQHYSLKYSKALARYFASAELTSTQEPRDVSAVAATIATDYKVLLLELKLLFGEIKVQQRHRVARAKHSVECEMDRLFARNTRTFEPIKYNAEAVLVGVIKATLKSMYEHVRLYSLARGAYQQVQVDISFLSNVWEGLCSHDNERLLSGLANEVVNSAKERCAEPVGLDDTVLESIVQHKRQRLKL
jgi:hypothetical protein